MRFLLHISLPVEKFNVAVRDGTAGEKIRQILEEVKPEAAYFCAKDGKRGGFLVVDVSDPSEIPRLAEPWFLQFDASVEFLPAMVPQDLQRAGLDKLGRDAIDVEGVDALHQCAGKAVFHAEQNADFLHCHHFLRPSVYGREAAA